MRVAEALTLARPLGVARLDSQLLLAHHLKQTRTWLLAHDDAAMAESTAAAFVADLNRRAVGMPLAYIVGEREFHGLRLRVTPDVLDPRADTEVLVDWAIELSTGSMPAVADLGTGSGAIALALKTARPNCQITATDISPAALAVATANAARLSLAIEFALGSWCEPLADRRFKLLLSNPPYIAENDHHLLALTFEPRLALTPGGDGTAALREIVSRAPEHLLADAWLLLEHGWDQGETLRCLLTERGFLDVQTKQDLGAQARCTGGRWPG